MQSPRILISGAGIAGMALAHWLLRVGIEPLLVERAAAFQPLGHFISLKGNGVDVIRDMGLESACRAREPAFARVDQLSADGHLLRRGSPSELDRTLGGYILLRRADLAEALFQSVTGKVQIRFGAEIAALKNDADAVAVTFSSGQTERFDFVFGADGIHSRTRRLVFGEGFEVPLGGHYFGLTEQGAHGLDEDRIRVYLGRGQAAMLLPTSREFLSAVFYRGAGGGSPEGRDPLSVKRFLSEAYRDFAPEVVKVIDAVSPDSFVFADVISQVRMPHLVSGRVALLGDAAHCPTFMSGMGASLALQGARALAGALSRHRAAPLVALADYERAIRPIADRYQASALSMRTFLLDRRAWVSSARDAFLRLAPDWVMDRQVRRFFDAERAASLRA